MSRLEKEKENGNWVGHIVEALNEKMRLSNKFGQSLFIV